MMKFQFDWHMFFLHNGFIQCVEDPDGRLVESYTEDSKPKVIKKRPAAKSMVGKNAAQSSCASSSYERDDSILV
jgi:hypothetical protein